MTYTQHWQGRIARLATGALVAVVGSLAAATPANADYQDDFINMAGPAAQRSQTEYGVPASVTVGQAILESGWGRSRLSQNDRNYFGVKCTSASNPGPIATGCRRYETEECTPTCHPEYAYFRVYATAEDSFRDHGRLLRENDRYAAAFRYTDNPNQFIREVARGGYATDPAYPDKVIRLMTDHNLYRFNASAPSCVGPATLYGVSGDSMLTVTQLADPARGGERSLGGQVIGRLPFVVKTIVALDFNTLFATDGSNLHRIEVINFRNNADSVTSRIIGQGGWTTDRLIYDGHGHLYGLTDGQLRRYNLSASYGIVSTTLLDASGWTLATLTGAANEWAVGTTAAGELVSYDLNPIRRYSLRPSTWTFRNLVSPGGGVYYAQKSDGSFYHFVDANPVNGSGNDIGPGKQIDAGGWTQRLLTAQPRTCT